jgi:hypothetical protein
MITRNPAVCMKPRKALLWNKFEKVSEGGLEPPCPLRALAPQASASAYSATRTRHACGTHRLSYLSKPNAPRRVASPVYLAARCRSRQPITAHGFPAALTTSATPPWLPSHPYVMGAEITSFQRRERGIHALYVAGGHVSPATAACQGHRNIRGQRRDRSCACPRPRPRPRRPGLASPPPGSATIAT